MKAEVRLGMMCSCPCGKEYEGLVITRVGHENMEILIQKIKEAGRDVAMQVVDCIHKAIEAAADEVFKQQVAIDFADKLDAAGRRQSGDWSDVVGHEFHPTPCPLCGAKNIPKSPFYYFVCDCGARTILPDKKGPACCQECNAVYETDYSLVKDN